MGIAADKWQAHLKAAEASGLSLVGYAQQQGIEVRRLYEARYRVARSKQARSRQVQAPTRQSSAFVRLKLRPPTPVKPPPALHGVPPSDGALVVQARLPNGVLISWGCERGNTSAQAQWLHTLAGLPCSD